jgi:DNA-binding NtrC family response regulator
MLLISLAEVIMTSLMDSGRENYRITVAYQDEAARRSILLTLKEAGYRRLAVVESARAVITHLFHSSIDLLITGLELIDTDSWRLVRMIRSGRFCPAQLPVILVCDDSQLPLAAPLAREHRVQLLPLSQLPGLPETVDAGIQGHARVKPSLLVIEDDPRAAHVVEAGLKGSYAIEIAADGVAGLAAWRARQHDLVLLDVQLPGLSGAEVLHRIMEAKPTQVVIIITAYPTLERHRELMLARATDFIAKPFNVNQLRRVCERALRHAVYQTQCARLNDEEKARDELTQHLCAADHYLTTGQPGRAAHHVKRALAASAPVSPSDDEWATLLTEFDPD